MDLVLSGHRHVPYVWSIAGVRVVHSGTVSTLRVRGTMPPSYNVIEIDADEVCISPRQSGQGSQGEEPLARFARQPVTTSRFYPELERFVRYHADPLSPPSGGAPSTPAPHPTRVGEARASEPETGPTITAVLELGVDGIMTDHRRLLRDVFAARGLAAVAGQRTPVGAPSTPPADRRSR